MPATAGATVSTARFQADVRKLGREIPHLSAAFLLKFLEDLRVLRLV
jgi:hypothetical protein